MHGEVEYETVECDSCGSEVAKEDARVEWVCPDCWNDLEEEDWET